MSYLGQDAVHQFIPNLIKERKYYSYVIKKYFHEELVMTKQDDENFETFTKCWICDNGFVKGDVKLRYH